MVLNVSQVIFGVSFEQKSTDTKVTITVMFIMSSDVLEELLKVILSRYMF